MKRLLQLITALTLMFTAAESKAQLANGSLAPDFTFTDLSGNIQHLYAILDSGYTTYIDVSAAWCGPCWAYHNTGALDGLYNTYGPHGTNVLRVLYIEGELTNTTAQLHGIPGTAVPNTGYNDNTQGDWVSTTAFPMIDLSSATPGASTFLSNTGYHIAYFPSIYMICPDRTITLVGQATTAQLYAAKAGCSIAVASTDAEFMPDNTLNNANMSLQSCDSVTPTFRLANIGTTPLTSAVITYKVDGVTQKVDNWTGNLATYNNTTVTGIKVGSSVPANHTITATVSSPNGGVDPTTANNSSTASFVTLSTNTGPLISETFESGGFPGNWTISNGGDPTTWTTGSVGYNSSQSAVMEFLYSPAGDIDYFTFDPMSFAGASSVQLTFDVSYAQYSAAINDKLEVDFSTNCGASWIPRYAKQGASLSTNGTNYYTSEYSPSSASQWRHETIGLNMYAGTTDLLVRFKGTSAQGNDVYVDNINFSMTLGIDEPSNISGVTVFPNPTADNANVNFNLSESTSVSIALYNAVGQEVIKSELGNLSIGAQNYLLNTEGLSNGLYFLTIKTGNGTITRKVSVNK